MNLLKDTLKLYSVIEFLKPYWIDSIKQPLYLVKCIDYALIYFLLKPSLEISSSSKSSFTKRPKVLVKKTYLGSKDQLISTVR